MADYWDTSCVIKLYCKEEDSDRYLDEVAGATEPLKSSALLEAELYFALQQKWLRKETEGAAPEDLFEKFLSDVRYGRIQLFPLGTDVIEESRNVARICFDAQPAVSLRTLDGLHLATARLLNCGRIFTTDERMKSAAKLIGFRFQDDLESAE
jgi:predicted nucleic acid-binding protein